MSVSGARYMKMFAWWFAQTGRRPRDLEAAVTDIWWLQTGMGIALKHPEYAQAWLASDPGGQQWDFLKAADSFVGAVSIEMALLLGEEGGDTMSCPVCESKAEGQELLRAIAPAITGQKITCSDACHERLIEAFEVTFGKYKQVARMTTGEVFRVPVRTIIEKGIREQDLDQYPRW